MGLWGALRAVSGLAYTTGYYQLEELPEEAISALTALEEHGLAERRGESIFIHPLCWQPPSVVKACMPSLRALKEAIGFVCRKPDVDWLEMLPLVEELREAGFLITLDYAAWELTRYQTPKDVYGYGNAEDASPILAKYGFVEKGRGVATTVEACAYVMPKWHLKDFDGDYAERVFLDCLALGGRAWLDAMAIWLLYKGKLRVRPRFRRDELEKVRDELLDPVTREGGLLKSELLKSVRHLADIFGPDNVVFVGAVAVFAHLNWRMHCMTRQIDAAIRAPPEMLDELVTKGKLGKYIEGGKVRYYTPYGIKVDFYMKNLAGIPVEEVFGRSVAKGCRLGKTRWTIKVVCLEHLLVSKLAARRPQDVDDIKTLLSRFARQIDWGSLRENTSRIT